MADLRATPMSNPIMGLLADRLKKVQQFGAKPFGYENPPVEMLMNLLGVPAVQQTMERMAYGEPLTTGSGMTTKPRPEAIEAAMAVAPVTGLLGKATKGLPVGASIEKIGKFDIVKRDASDIFGEGAQRIRYIDPKSNGQIEVLARQDGTASVLSLEVPEKFSGQKIGESLQKQVLQDFPDMQGQVSSKAAATTAYRLGRRPVDMPNATLKDVHKMIDEDSSVNLISPQMQERINPSTSYPQKEALDTAQRNAALPIEKGGLGLPKDNTAMDRAKAMGFDIETLHGSPNPNIEAFDPMMAGGNTGNAFDNNIFATSSPESAGGYALNWKHYRNTIKTSPEFKAIVREENDLESKIGNLREAGDTKGVADIKARLDELKQQRDSIYNDFTSGKLGSEGSTIYPLMVRGQDFLPYEAEGANWMRANRPAIDAAEQAGYSGALIKNVKDNAAANLGSIADIVASQDPSRFRSRFAAFDPMRRNEADILAGVLPLGLLADEEQRKKLYELMPSLLGQ